MPRRATATDPHFRFDLNHIVCLDLPKVPKTNGSLDREIMTELSEGVDNDRDVDGNSLLQADVGPQPLTIMKAR